MLKNWISKEIPKEIRKRSKQGNKQKGASKPNGCSSTFQNYIWINCGITSKSGIQIWSWALSKFGRTYIQNQKGAWKWAKNQRHLKCQMHVSQNVLYLSDRGKHDYSNV